jgi:hypothetical protein
MVADLKVRGGPSTIPDCISTCKSTIAPIFVQIGKFEFDVIRNI